MGDEMDAQPGGASMKRFGRRQFLGALAGSVALLPLRKILSQGKAMAQGRDGAAGAKPLKAVIVYYSATGCTARIAKAIHRGMSSQMSCDLLKLKKADPKKMAQYDVVGIGGPIWFYRDTANLKLFIHKMPDMGGRQSFLFCTHGTEPKGFFASLWDTLSKRNVTLIGWNDWFGGVYQVLHAPKPYLTDGHPDAIDLAEAEAFGWEMAERAKRISAGENNVAPDIPQGAGIDGLWIRHDIGGMSDSVGPKTGSSIGTGVTASAATVTAGVIAQGKRAAAGAAGGGPSAKAAVPESGGPGGGPGGVPGGASGGPGGGGSGGGGFPGAAGAGLGGTPGGGSQAKALPELDISKCIYPRCDACVFGCPVDAIDLSLAITGGKATSNLIIKNACISCGLCERMCSYDAITYRSSFIPKSSHQIDMSKCTYPKCTLCADKCPMNSIDFSTRPPTCHNNCEGCDLCYSLCPHDAISIPNIAESQIPLAAAMNGPDSPFALSVSAYEKAGRFRRLVPLDKVGFHNPAYKNKNAPRIVLNEDDEATYCDQPCKL
jgi:ferredoxin